MEGLLLRTRKGVLDQTDQPSFDALKGRLAGGTAPLLVHLHGGLVSQDSGEETANRLMGSGAHAYNAPAAWEQVYFIWRTGLFEQVFAHWRDLHDNDRLYRALLERLLGFIGGKVTAPTGRSVAGEAGLSPAEIRARLDARTDAPFADLDTLAGADRRGRAAEVTELSRFEFEQQLSAILHSDREFTEAAADISAAVAPSVGRASDHGDPRSGAPMLARLDGAVQAELEVEAAAAPDGAGGRAGLVSLSALKSLVSHALKIGWRVYRRVRGGRDHGTHATIVEEILRELYANLIGGTIWRGMKQDAAAHFADGGAGAMLLDAIEAAGKRRIVLVGHSAGAIWASEMLLEMARRESKVKVDLVLLAPAVRGALFAEAIAAASGLIERFRMFCMNDARERADPVMGKGTGFLYPSSLLYLVSGLFEADADADAVDAPLVGLERFRKWRGGSLGPAEDAAAAAIGTFLAGKDHAEIYAKEDNGPGRRSDGQSHGGMDDDTWTLESVATFFAP